MAQHDLDIANGSGAAVRGDINDALEALVTLSSGASAPSTTFPYQWWVDETNNVVKQRNSANTQWIIRGTSGVAGVSTKTGAYTVTLNDFGRLFSCDASGGDFTVTLPAAATAGDGFTVAVKNSGTSGAVTIDGNSAETIDGSATIVLRTRGTGVVLRCDGTGWRVMSQTGSILLGRHSIWLPAGAWRPSVTSGCASLASRETTAGRHDIQWLLFDSSSDEHAQATIRMPESWDGRDIYFRVVWSTTATDTDGVAWALQASSRADGESFDVDYGTAVVVTDDNTGAAEEVLISDLSSAVTPAGTPAGGELLCLDIFRDVSDANDDMTEDAGLVGVVIYYTVSSGTDD